MEPRSASLRSSIAGAAPIRLRRYRRRRPFTMTAGPVSRVMQTPLLSDAAKSDYTRYISNTVSVAQDEASRRCAMNRFVSSLAALSALFLVAGCATDDMATGASVTRFHLGQPIVRGAIAIEAVDPHD